MLPENPTNNQTYRDSNGNSWIYNAMLMRWMMSSPGGNTYYYYPSQGLSAGMGIRETSSKVTDNLSEFIPHIIE